MNSSQNPHPFGLLLLLVHSDTLKVLLPQTRWRGGLKTGKGKAASWFEPGRNSTGLRSIWMVCSDAEVWQQPDLH